MYWIDNHCDVLFQMWNRARTKPSSPRGEFKSVNLFLLEDSPLDVTLPSLLHSNIIMQNFAIFVPSETPQSEKLGIALKQIDIFHEQVAPYLQQITSSTDMSLLSLDRVGAILTLEGGEALCGELSNLRLFYRLGVRQIGLTWNNPNALADGCWEPRGGGLTMFGKKCIEEMIRLGMIVDVSHLSEQGFWDVLSIPKAKVMASHSNCHLLCPHVRNLTDQQIKALIAHDGMIGITYVPQFVNQPYTEATIYHLIGHIEHIWKLGGEDHIAFGSDFDGMGEKISGLENTYDIPSFYEILTQYFPKSKVHKWTYQNAYRFYKHSLG
jgi:membrane dipeptidase